MLCSLLESEFVGFLWRSARAMGCFFGCFRIRDDHRHPQTHLVSEPVPSLPKEPVVSRNRLSSLLLAEDNDGLLRTNKENPALGTPQRGNNDRDLKEEARFLKACGTLPETPVEFRKGSQKFKDISFNDGDLEPSQFHSWLPNTSIEKLHLEKQPDQPPTPIKLCEERIKGLGSLEHTPSSISSGQDAGRILSSSFQGHGFGSLTNQATSTSPSPVKAEVLAGDVQGRNKSVRFECEDDVTSSSSTNSALSGIVNKNLRQLESIGNYSVVKPSPYPTPLKLSEEMQTPGTVFPAYLESTENAKNPRIRSQYVYSVLNPIENLPQCKVLSEEESCTHQLSGHVGESVGKADHETPESEVGMRGQASVEKEMKVEASLSSWLKPQSNNQEGESQRSGSISSGMARRRRIPSDRPIIGMVAAHWNEEEPSHISPKNWDGNGIPNSTNKYKEDQKVNWHATPFEERLEKALSDETSIPQRKHINEAPALKFEDTEESDTALSQLQSSNHFKPVVSF